MQEFIDCIKTRKRTHTPVEIAHRSQTPGHLGHIAAITGRTLKWDAFGSQPDTLRTTGELPTDVPPNSLPQ